VKKERAELVEKNHPKLSMRTQCNLLEVSRSSLDYLLRNLEVTRPDQVWCADITYVPMPRGHAYLCAVMDWHSRKVLGWRLSNTMDAALCLGALADAVAQSGGRLPEIFNTDHGSQFTGEQWTGRLEQLGIAISMDVKGRWMDNVFIERLWRSVKHEKIYLREHGTLPELEAGLKAWFERYNTWRPHQNLGNQTPSQVHHKQTRKVPAGTPTAQPTKAA
jgi:putative transposase